ncbi:hypothetical protein AKO1_011322, partial [Acrasis kona]
MTRNTCPSSFFDFDGKEGGLIMDNVYFPGNGYTFCSWIRLERASHGSPLRFFSFFDRKQNGLELQFRGNHLVVQVVAGVKKVIKVSFDHTFQANKWYFISVTHNKRFLLSNEIQLYVDGELRQTCELKYPSIAGKLAFGHFGTNVPYSSQLLPQTSAFCGQCGPIAIFDKVLVLQEVQRIFWCGPDFQFTFRKGDSQPRYFDWPGIDQMSQKLFLCYNPRACTKDACPDNSQIKKPESCHARLLSGTSVFTTRHVRDTLNCIGGVQVIIPLLNLLKQDWTVDYSMCARIVSLITEMLRHSRINQDTMLQND